MLSRRKLFAFLGLSSVLAPVTAIAASKAPSPSGCRISVTDDPVTGDKVVAFTSLADAVQRGKIRLTK